MKIADKIKKIFYIFIFFMAIKVYSAPDSFIISNQKGADVVSIQNQKIDVSTGSFQQIVTSGSFISYCSSFSVINSTLAYFNVTKFQVGQQATHTENVKFVVSANTDHMLLEQSNGGADNKKWLIKVNGGNLEYLITDDAWSAWNLSLRLNRNGNVVGTVEVSTNVKFGGVNATGSGTASLGTNSPASTLSAPYTWIEAMSADGTIVLIPAWKK